MRADYTPPDFLVKAFHCPFCNAYARQDFQLLSITFDEPYENGSMPLESNENMQFYSSKCDCCSEVSFWKSKKESDSGFLLYPISSTAPLPHQDMPSEVKEIYEEARSVANLSPRAAAALLRVALEKLTEHLGEVKGSLHERIGNLRKKELSESVIQSLNIVRITANEGGAHAGQIDLTGKDGDEIVGKLFKLMNLIVEKTITDPKTIAQLQEQLPEDKKRRN